MTATTADHHTHAPAPPTRGRARRLLLGAGWIRAAWMTTLFAAIGFGIVVLLRWWGNWQPLLDGQPKAECFIPGNIHMLPAGYALWKSVIAPVIVPAEKPFEKTK